MNTPEPANPASSDPTPNTREDLEHECAALKQALNALQKQHAVALQVVAAARTYCTHWTIFEQQPDWADERNSNAMALSQRLGELDLAAAAPSADALPMAGMDVPDLAAVAAGTLGGALVLLAEAEAYTRRAGMGVTCGMIVDAKRQMREARGHTVSWSKPYSPRPE